MKGRLFYIGIRSILNPQRGQISISTAEKVKRFFSSVDSDIKENENFRRFNYRSEEKVYKEFMLYAIGRNIMKYHRFLHHEIKKFEGKKGQKAA